MPRSEGRYRHRYDRNFQPALVALTAALFAGDTRHAIELLWDLHRNDILRYCRRMLGSDAEAADATQKVFEHAITGLVRLRSVHSVRRWLVAIARHRCLDHARSARRGPQLVDATAFDRIAAALIAEPAGDDSRTIKHVDECLERLNADDRELIELRYYKGLPFKEIAKQLGRTPATLRVRLVRACRKLRLQLEQPGVTMFARTPTTP
jgi:RNA polymerase sigma-70 factor (ECF subfamily)